MRGVLFPLTNTRVRCYELITTRTKKVSTISHFGFTYENRCKNERKGIRSQKKDIDQMYLTEKDIKESQNRFL